MIASAQWPDSHRSFVLRVVGKHGAGLQICLQIVDVK